MHVHLVCDMDIRGGCCGMGATWSRIGYNVNHMVLSLLEIVSFNSILSFESWVDIQVCGGVGLVVLKLAGEYLG